MISLLKSGSTVTFTFDENSGYLQNGTINVPVNSLSLITDESDMATFRKSASNDIFISARYEEFGMSKAELETWYKVYMVGDVGGGVDSGTVQTMIDESISGKADTTAVTESIAEATSGKVNTTTYTAYTSSTQTILNSKLGRNEVINELSQWSSSPVQSKALFNELNISGLTMDEENVDIIENNANDWTYDEGASGPEAYSHECPSYLRKVEFTISADTDCSGFVGVEDSNRNGQVHVNFRYFPAITDPDDPSYPQDAYFDYTDLYVEVNNDDFEPLSSSTFSVSGATITLEIPNFKVYDEYEDVYKYYNWALVDGEALRYQLYNGEYISGVVTASASGAVVTYTPVKDAVEDVEESLSGKQDTLSAGTNITISGNVISAEGGGKAIEAGRGISVTTGETADTVSFNLPISAGTGADSLVVGVNCKANGSKSFVGGQASSGTSEGSFAFGQNCKAGQWSIAVGNVVDASNIRGAAAFGEYNVVSGNMYSDSSGLTIFSVGNGARANARHNAFEIRKNGDIYLTKDGQDVKLQDQLGGGVTPQEFSAYTAATDSRLTEDEEVTAAGLNAVNSALGGLKLQQITQSAYDALVTKDASTLYIIVN